MLINNFVFLLCLTITTHHKIRSLWSRNCKSTGCSRKLSVSMDSLGLYIALIIITEL